jgi:hypothetical protein
VLRRVLAYPPAPSKLHYLQVFHTPRGNAEVRRSPPCSGFCKPEVTGSIPVRSIIGPKSAAARPQHDDFGRFLLLAESRVVPTPAKPASAAWKKSHFRRGVDSDRCLTRSIPEVVYVIKSDGLLV